MIEDTPIADDETQMEAISGEKVTVSRPRRTKKTLPPVLKGLMGEANLRLARGEVELATTICMEIIRY